MHRLLRLLESTGDLRQCQAVEVRQLNRQARKQRQTGEPVAQPRGPGGVRRVVVQAERRLGQADGRRAPEAVCVGRTGPACRACLFDRQFAGQSEQKPRRSGAVGQKPRRLGPYPREHFLHDRLGFRRFADDPD